MTMHEGSSLPSRRTAHGVHLFCHVVPHRYSQTKGCQEGGLQGQGVATRETAPVTQSTRGMCLHSLVYAVLSLFSNAVCWPNVLHKMHKCGESLRSKFR